MKEKEYSKLIEMTNMGGGWIPANENAEELLEQSTRGEILSFHEVTARDLNFHRGYMGLLGFIYDYLPASFKKKVEKKNFYKFVKHLRGEYEVLFTFKDGTQMVEYESIAFGNMSQKRFESYVRDQLPFIYENVIGQFFSGKMYDGIIATIEEEFQKYLSRL